MMWFHVYLSSDYKGTYYNSDTIEAIKECFLRNKIVHCSNVLITWLDDEKKPQSRVYLDCELFNDVYLVYKEEGK